MLDWINVFKVNRKIKSRLWPWIKIILSIILFFAVFYGDIYVHILDKTKTGRIVEALILVVFSFLDYLICFTSVAEMSTLGTQNKEKQIKTNQNKLNHLSDSPQGENGGGKILKIRKVMTQEDINNLQPPSDGMQRNFEGLLENLHSYKIPPSEQYAIILKSNFGAIGHPVWKGFSSIRGSNGKIKLPGHYLLSVIN